MAIIGATAFTRACVVGLLAVATTTSANDPHATAHSGAKVFLGSRDQHMSAQHHGVSDLLAELEKTVGEHQRLATERRVGRLEEALRPMFAAMPHGSDGRLGQAAVRYLLHRLFVQRHGWFVNGLENAGDSWNSSSPSQVFKVHAGQDVHNIFEEKLNSTGFSLHQVAVFAATLEALVHTDSLERLETAYKVLGFSFDDKDGKLSETDVAKVVNAYMQMFVLSMDHSTIDAAIFEDASDSILEVYPTWPDTEVFAREVRNSVLVDVPVHERTTWNATLKVLEEVGERYGRWQDTECRVLKKTLMELEEAGTGRVTLDKFYGSSLTDASWQFMESVPYLRQLGALDESDPQHLRVVIPNYVNSPSNCVASSKFYSVCCIDECEALLGHLEDRIAAPDATPALIVQMVSALPSDTVAAPRELPESLKQRLDDVAAHHGGRVPLHGRLFSQWMHHAYPRECPYPHMSGTTSPMTALTYMKEVGGEVEASSEEIKEILREAAERNQVEGTPEAPADLPWTAEEELFVCRPDVEQPNSQSSTGLGGKFASLGAAISLAFGLLRLFKQSGLEGSKCMGNEKYFV